MSVNKVIVIGNLGADPVVRSLASGQNVANLSLATTERFTDRSGARQVRTEWHRVVAFGRLADTCERFLSKGRQVYVEGRVSVHTWDDSQTGEKRARMEISAQNLVLLGQRGDDAGSSPDRAPTTENAEFDSMPF